WAMGMRAAPARVARRRGCSSRRRVCRAVSPTAGPRRAEAVSGPDCEARLSAGRVLAEPGITGPPLLLIESYTLNFERGGQFWPHSMDPQALAVTPSMSSSHGSCKGRTERAEAV